MSFISYAQNREDVLLYRSLQNVARGFYIDIGANHPKIDSVTQAFYDRGWTGINVEPIYANYKKLTKSRSRDTNLNLAVSDFNGVIDFYEVDGSGLSTTIQDQALTYNSNGALIEKYSVPCVTLEKLCKDYVQKELHFLKIDVEGAEEQVIRGGDWINYRPWIILVESTLPNTSTMVHHTWEPFLLMHNYKFATFDGLNRFYVASERSYLLDFFLAPVCCMDNYIPYSEYKLLQSFYLMQLDIDFQQTEIKNLKHANENMSAILKRINSFPMVRAAKKVLKIVRAKKNAISPRGSSFIHKIKIGVASTIYRISPVAYGRILKIKQKWRC